LLDCCLAGVDGDVRGATDDSASCAVHAGVHSILCGFRSFLDFYLFNEILLSLDESSDTISHQVVRDGYR
jgi:hypothetical protein